MNGWIQHAILLPPKDFRDPIPHLDETIEILRGLTVTPKTTTPVVVTTPVIVTSQNIFSQQEVMSIASEDEMQDDGNDDGWKRTVGEEESGGDGRGECQGGGDSDEDRSMKGIDDNEDESGDELEPGYIGYTGAKGKKSRDGGGGGGGGCRSGGGGGENGEDGETDEDEPYLKCREYEDLENDDNVNSDDGVKDDSDGLRKVELVLAKLNLSQ